MICTNPRCLVDFEPLPEEELINDKYGSPFCCEDCKEEYDELDW